LGCLTGDVNDVDGLVALTAAPTGRDGRRTGVEGRLIVDGLFTVIELKAAEVLCLDPL